MLDPHPVLADDLFADAIAATEQVLEHQDHRPAKSAHRYAEAGERSGRDDLAGDGRRWVYRFPRSTRPRR